MEFIAYQLGVAASLRRPFDLANLANDISQLKTLSKQCHEFVRCHHNLSVVAAKLIHWDSSARLHDYLSAHGLLLLLANGLNQKLRKKIGQA
jgi:hypothetical protein